MIAFYIFTTAVLIITAIFVATSRKSSKRNESPELDRQLFGGDT